MTKKVDWLVKVAMLSAIAVVLMLFEFPLPFIAPPFYELDFSEIPVLLGTFALGPLAGVVIEFMKVLLNLLINGTITMGVGEAANFLMGIAFVLPAGLIYRHNKSKKSAILGMVIGGVCMVAIGALVNAYILVPAYGKALSISTQQFVEMGTKIHPSIDSFAKLVILCVVPFNTIKVILVSLAMTFIYKPLSPILKGKHRN